MSPIFVQAFVYLLCAVIAVPVAKRLGLSSVLGYLVAGMIIGRFGLGLVGDEGESVMHFAEFGVVMMLFLIGLELQPSMLWRMRAPILGLGGGQVVLTAIVILIVSLLCGLNWQTSLAIGLALALSSTAIVLQTMSEKNLTKTDAGPIRFFNAPNALRRLSISRRSQYSNATSLPISATNSALTSRLKSTKPTRAPWAAKALTISAPMPEPPPDTITDLPFRSGYIAYSAVINSLPFSLYAILTR